MFLKRYFLYAASVSLALGLAGAGQAAKYSLQHGSGAQTHIGNGLALPIQAAFGGAGNALPPLLIPVKPGVVTVQGTSAMTKNQKITVPAGVLSHPAIQKTVGVFASNPTLYAVATDLQYTWPAAPAVFTVNGRGGPATQVITATLATSLKIRYSPRVVGKRFGGVGRFHILAGPPAGIIAAPVTVYAIAVKGPGNPPCTNPAFGGGNAACVAALIEAKPGTLAAAGGPVNVKVTTTPANVKPGVGNAKAGPGGAPISLMTLAKTGPVNNAKSRGYPWTTGKITVSAMTAAGAPEVFKLSGADNRTKLGGGTVQMVSGALSTRTLSGQNANRAWLLLKLHNISAVPALSDPLRLGTFFVLMLIGVGFVMRGRFAGTTSA